MNEERSTRFKGSRNSAGNFSSLKQIKGKVITNHTPKLGTFKPSLRPRAKLGSVLQQKATVNCKICSSN